MENMLIFNIQQTAHRTHDSEGPMYLIITNLLLETVIFLTEIRDKNRYHRHKHLGWSGVDLADFHEELEPEIVHQQVHHHNRNIAHQLLSPTHGRLRESHVFIQPKPGQQRNRKHDAERENMRRDGGGKDSKKRGWEVDDVSECAEQNVIKNKIKHPIEHHISTPACGIPKQFGRHNFSELRHDF